jgi:hypothetical protein
VSYFLAYVHKPYVFKSEIVVALKYHTRKYFFNSNAPHIVLLAPNLGTPCLLSGGSPLLLVLLQMGNELLTFSSEGPMRPWEINYALVRAQHQHSPHATLHFALCSFVIVEHFGPKASKILQR